jgi:hypothetical protein
MLKIEYAKGGGVYEVEAERRWKRWNLRLGIFPYRTFLVLFQLLIHRTISNLPWNLSVAI